MDTRPRQQAGGDIGQADDVQVELFKDRDDLAQGRIVAPRHRRHQARQQLGRRRVDQCGVQTRAHDGPGKGHIADAAVRQQVEKRHQTFDAKAHVRGQAIGREPVQTGHQRAIGQARHQCRRQGPAPGNDGHASRCFHLAPLGVRKLRSDADRMKSVISRTWAESVSSDRRRARSRKLPSPCASI